MTNQQEDIERSAVLAHAKLWLGTPYHPEARVIGVGVDCATMIAETYQGAGKIPMQDIEHYPPDWHLHRSKERYLEHVFRYAKELPEENPRAKLPGNLVLFRFGRCYSHGAIIVKWPRIIHAYLDTSVCYENVEAAKWLNTIGEATDDIGKARPRKFFSLWE